ncbi:phage portal protein [Cytobacillus sp. S13-E01]|uniref:phage portal protein n=1 Tax=Cytobacillus sp. S13-E01 TaxID=3031326 RepID=UPI0023D7CADD|nr:phage portal protein [Cytobacillus sp. S13-E01]MDF0727253.1 phage portal protein [Cytobacillus sp. S13-E01]
MPLFNNKQKDEIRALNAKVEKLEKRELKIGGVSIPSISSINNVPSGSNEDNVLKIPTVSACVDLITGSIAQMPVYLYKQNANGSIEKVEDKRVSLLNHENEAEVMSAIDFKKLMVTDYLLRGQAFAYLGKQTETIDVGGSLEEIEELVELNHQPAKNIQVEPLHDGIKYVGAKYTKTTMTGKLIKRTRKTEFSQDQLLRVLNNPINAFEGVGVLKRGKDVFEQALAEMEYTKALYNNGAMPKGILKTSGRLSQPAIDRLRDSWSSMYAGVKSSAKTIILEEGMDYQALSMKPNEIQISETSKETESKICKLFNVPESMISSSANKYNSIGQNQLHFLKHTLAPIITSFEGAFDRQLLTEQEKREGYYFRFDTSELLRATEKERVEAIGEGLAKGIYTINEARQKLDLPDIDEDMFMWGLQTVLYNPKTGEMKVPNMDGGNKNEN